MIFKLVEIKMKSILHVGLRRVLHVKGSATGIDVAEPLTRRLVFIYRLGPQAHKPSNFSLAFQMSILHDNGMSKQVILLQMASKSRSIQHSCIHARVMS